MYRYNQRHFVERVARECGWDSLGSIRAGGATRDEAWWEAIRQAELIGTAGRNGDVP